MTRALPVLLCLLAAGCVATHPRESGSAALAGPRPAPSSASSPEPPAGEIVNNDCLACHSPDLVRQQRLTDKQWGKSIDKMRNWGAPTAPSDIEPLVSYLTAAYSRDSGRYVPESISAEAAAALFEPLPDGALAGGDRERGLALYQDRCLPCHAEEGRGGPDAVALAGRHVLDRAPEFLEVIRGGRGRMPPAGDTTEKEAADLLAYLRSLP